jgi:hypothetical protein
MNRILDADWASMKVRPEGTRYTAKKTPVTHRYEMPTTQKCSAISLCNTRK